VHILSAPCTAKDTPSADAYRAFPLKGAVGRHLHGRGLTVTLLVSEDLESFEATTEIEITSPAQPWLGTVRLADDGTIEWDCDWRAAFHGDPATLIDTIVPILRTGTRPGGSVPGEWPVCRRSTTAGREAQRGVPGGRPLGQHS
jgi:hypothetical protein